MFFLAAPSLIPLLMIQPISPFGVQPAPPIAVLPTPQIIPGDALDFGQHFGLLAKAALTLVEQISRQGRRGSPYPQATSLVSVFTQEVGDLLEPPGLRMPCSRDKTQLIG